MLLGAGDLGAFTFVKRRIGQVIEDLFMRLFQGFDQRGHVFKFLFFPEGEFFGSFAFWFGFFGAVWFRFRKDFCFGLFFLFQPIIVSADIFGDLAVPFKDKDARNQVIQKRTVMTYQKHIPLIIQQQFFQQFKGLGIQIVGGFVQYQKV